MAAEAQPPASESEASEPDVTWNDEEFAAGFKKLLKEVKAGATDPEDENELREILINCGRRPNLHLQIQMTKTISRRFSKACWGMPVRSQRATIRISRRPQ